MIIILFIVLGLISGLIGGLLGIGGGIVVVPALYFLFKGFGLYESHLMQVAVCTALASSFVTSGSSTVLHMLKGAVSGSILKFLIPGILLGVIIGACIGHFISSEILSALFGGLAIFFGVYFCFPTLRFFIANKPNITLIFFSPGIGILSSLLGIGGGIITFPILLGYQVNVKEASANSSAATMFSTFIGTLTYIWLTWKDPHLPHSFGLIDIPAFISIGLTSIFTASIGVKLAHSLKVNLIKQIFGVCLSLVGISMFVL